MLSAHNPRVARRVHVPHLQIGTFDLPESEAHHLRDVLRLTQGTAIEVFDDAGNIAHGELVTVTAGSVTVRVSELREDASGQQMSLTIAAAVPKGDRADWMIEKLSEIGVDRFIPLAAERSVVLPEGKNKRERWMRIATEAAKQSRRRGVMQIDALRSPADAGSEVLRRAGCIGLCLSTERPSKSLAEVVRQSNHAALFIGPEGGWTPGELERFDTLGLTAVRLTDTILRIETAAVVAAGVVRCVCLPGIA